MAKLIKSDNTLSVRNVSRLTGIPDRTLYNHLSVKTTQTEIDNAYYSRIITFIFNLHKGRIGALKIRNLMSDEFNINLSELRVKALMNDNGLIPITVRKPRDYPHHADSLLPNLLGGNFTSSNPNAIWVTDITYLKTVNNKNVYLSSVIDLFSRKVIAFKLSTTMDTTLVADTLTTAINNRSVNTSHLIIHTDQGTQYKSQEFESLLNALGITHSYSRPGIPTDNAVIESFHSVFKNEMYNHKNYRNIDDLTLEVFKYINYFNNLRPHGYLNFKTPNQFEYEYQNSHNTKIDIRITNSNVNYAKNIYREFTARNGW
jgi:transposase InsO family protein